MKKPRIQRVILSESPFRSGDAARHWAQRGLWPACWLKWPDSAPNAGAYRLKIHLDETLKVRLHLCGDRKYQLFLNGEFCGIGPELGDLNHYFFDSFDLELPAGEHWLAALVFDFKSVAGVSEMGLRPAWLLAAEGVAPEQFNTGFAPWEVLPLHAWSWLRELSVNPHFELNYHAYPRRWEVGGGSGWQPAAPAEFAANHRIRNEFSPERLLEPARLPPRHYRPAALLDELWVFDTDSGPVEPTGELKAEKLAWREALTGGVPFTVPKGAQRRIVGRLKNYYCFYPRLKVSGGNGATLHFRWAESLFTHAVFDEAAPVKGNRQEVDGKYFLSYGHDRFVPDGECDAEFFTPWWRCGRYFEIMIRNGAEALEVGELHFFETRYPFESEVAPACSDERINRILPLCLRTLQMCMHDTFMDCPYYEQLMYIGDARLEALTVLAANRDSRLPEKMLRMFAASRRPEGWLYSRYPSRICQIIPTFSPLWIGALHDYACFRDNRPLVRELIGTARQIIDAFETRLNPEGLVEFEQGWNFVDWTPDWCRNGNPGVPPHGEYGVSGVVNWLFIYALAQTAELCDYLGEPLAAAHLRQRAREQTQRVIAAFWSDERGLLADDPARSLFSEHAQCLAILSGTLPETLHRRIASTLFTAVDLAPASIYFSHYYFECCRRLYRTDALMRRLELWFACDGLGLATLLERPEPSRSDCHGWSAHPYFHLAATLGGIRPGAFAFQSVIITPQPASLNWLRAQMIHPRGKIEVEYQLKQGLWHGKILLPEGLTGTLELPGSPLPTALYPGMNLASWPAGATAIGCPGTLQQPYRAYSPSMSSMRSN